MGAGEVRLMRQRERSYAVSKAYDHAESPIEADFWHQMRKTNWTPWKSIAGQVNLGKYRVDCLLEFSDQRLVVELDGKEFHDEADDLRRDKILLTDHGITWVVRIPGSSIYMMPNATMRVLAEWWNVFGIGRETGVIRSSELRGEMEKSINRDGVVMSDSEWLAECGTFYHVWDADETTGFVACPEAVLKSWNIRRIRRRKGIRRG